MDQKKIGAFIAARRKEQGMTQVQFAEKLGVTNKAVSKWETGRCLPDASLFGDVCLLLGVTLNELLAGETIPAEQRERKAEENLAAMAASCQRRPRPVIRAGVVSLCMGVIAASVNRMVGGPRLDGSPVFSCLLLFLLLLWAWGTFVVFSREEPPLRRVALGVNGALFLSAGGAFLLDFWGGGALALRVGFPAGILLYGLRLIFSWPVVYALGAVLAGVGLWYGCTPAGKPEGG